MTPDTLLDVDGLSIAFGPDARAHGVVHDLSFSVARGETLAIVGESGSGKTVTALAVAGLLPHSARITGGGIRFAGRDIGNLAENELRRLRGSRIAMVFQEPMTSLNPVLPISRQMTEGFIAHRRAAPAEAKARAVAMLAQVGIRDPERRLGEYPHELSGGMRQRVMIAMAMMMEPALLVADEPTTALDVTVQAQVLDLMRRLTAERGTSLLLITHDMGVVAEMADRVLVMQRGRAVEQARAPKLFGKPEHPYTQALLAAVPRLDGAVAPQEKAKPPVLLAERVTKSFGRGRLFGGSPAPVLDDVSLGIGAGETVALVGESGSGKSTLGRALARLIEVDRGTVRLDGENLSRLSGGRLRKQRAKIQMIFQDPYASLDPRFTVARTVAEPMLVHGLARRNEAAERAAELLGRVGLDRRMAGRFPHELSGGQRQRVAIARALAAEPKIIVADEPTSALDVSVQARILDLLEELREERGIALLFISHDLAVVRHIASRVAVMRGGRLLELGPTGAVLKTPRHAYTRALLAAVPVSDPAMRNGRRHAEAGSDRGPSGPLAEVAPGHWVAQSASRAPEHEAAL